MQMLACLRAQRFDLTYHVVKLCKLDRIARSDAFKTTMINVKTDLAVLPKGPNGHPLWTEPRHSKATLQDICEQLGAKFSEHDYVFESSCHPDFLTYIQSTPAKWKGVVKSGAPAKYRYMCSLLQEEKLVAEVADQGPIPEVIEAEKALTWWTWPEDLVEHGLNKSATDPQVLVRCADTIVKSLDDPMPQTASAPPGEAIQNDDFRDKHLSPKLQLASGLHSAALLMLPSRVIRDGNGLWPSRNYKKGDLVFSATGLLWKRGPMKYEDELGDASACFQVNTVRQDKKTGMKLHTILSSSKHVAANVHYVTEGCTSANLVCTVELRQLGLSGHSMDQYGSVSSLGFPCNKVSVSNGSSSSSSSSSSSPSSPFSFILIILANFSFTMAQWPLLQRVAIPRNISTSPPSKGRDPYILTNANQYIFQPIEINRTFTNFQLIRAVFCVSLLDCLLLHLAQGVAFTQAIQCANFAVHSPMRHWSLVRRICSCRGYCQKWWGKSSKGRVHIVLSAKLQLYPVSLSRWQCWSGCAKASTKRQAGCIGWREQGGLAIPGQWL